MEETNNNCAECNSPDVVREVKDYTYPYGIGNKQVKITSKVPVYCCLSCGFQWINYETEEIMDKDIAEYLEKNK